MPACGADTEDAHGCLDHWHLVCGAGGAVCVSSGEVAGQAIVDGGLLESACIIRTRGLRLIPHKLQAQFCRRTACTQCGASHAAFWCGILHRVASTMMPRRILMTCKVPIVTCLADRLITLTQQNPAHAPDSSIQAVSSQKDCSTAASDDETRAAVKQALWHPQ